MTGWDDPTLIQGALCGWPGQKGKRLGCRDRPFCFSASSMGENPVFSVGLLQWAKWWRQVPRSPNEDRKMGMVERKFIDD